MKKIFFKTFALSLSISPFIHAQIKSLENDLPSTAVKPIQKKKKPQLVSLYTEIIDISAADYIKLSSNPALEFKNHDKLRKHLIGLVKQGKVKLITNQYVTIKVGSDAEFKPTNAELKSTNAYSYPLVFRFPEGATDKKNTPSIPAAFESTDVGSKIKISAYYNKSGILVCFFRPTIVTLKGQTILKDWNTKSVKAVNQLPVFETAEAEKTIPLKNGKFILAEVKSPSINKKIDKTRKILFFLKADLLYSQNK